MISSLVFHLTHITTIINRVKEDEELIKKKKRKTKELTRIIIIIQIKYLDNRARNTHQQKIRIFYI